MIDGDGDYDGDDAGGGDGDDGEGDEGGDEEETVHADGGVEIDAACDDDNGDGDGYDDKMMATARRRR